MLKRMRNEYENLLNNVEFNTKLAHFHNMNKEDLDLMYKNFYKTNNLSSFSNIDDVRVDNLSFSLYEQWLVRFDDY